MKYLSKTANSKWRTENDGQILRNRELDIYEVTNYEMSIEIEEFQTAGTRCRI